MQRPASSTGGESKRALPRHARLRRRGEFLAVQREGRSYRAKHVVAVARRNGLEQTRLGVTVSRRVGKAVERNRVKRRLREIFRHHQEVLPPGLDVVLIARTGSSKAGFGDLRDEVVGLFQSIAEKHGGSARRGSGLEGEADR